MIVQKKKIHMAKTVCQCNQLAISYLHTVVDGNHLLSLLNNRQLSAFLRTKKRFVSLPNG